MNSELIIPEVNRVYQNKNGSSYRCVEVYSGYSAFVNVLSGWMLYAHEVRLYEDGKIEWDWSEGGHFVRV